MNRLDRFLLSVSWEELFRDISQVKLRRPVQDHWPIVPCTDVADRGPRPFRFNNACTALIMLAWDTVTSWIESRNGGLTLRLTVGLAFVYIKN